VRWGRGSGLGAVEVVVVGAARATNLDHHRLSRQITVRGTGVGPIPELTRGARRRATAVVNAHTIPICRHTAEPLGSARRTREVRPLPADREGGLRVALAQLFPVRAADVVAGRRAAEFIRGTSGRHRGGITRGGHEQNAHQRQDGNNIARSRRRPVAIEQCTKSINHRCP